MHKIYIIHFKCTPEFLYREVKAAGLQGGYSEDPSFIETVRMIAALAFVVGEAFETIQSELP